MSETTQEMKEEKNFQRYQRADWVHPAAYPVDQPVDESLYRPVAPWIGRLILLARRERDLEGGVDFEVHHAPPEYAHLVGQTVRLRFCTDRATQARTWAVTRNVIFNSKADDLIADGYVLSERINRWRLVTPLESLAAGYPTDEMIVRLADPVTVEPMDNELGEIDGTADSMTIVRIEHEPVQISGRYVGLVTFIEPAHESGDSWRVRHFNPATRAFDGEEEVVAVPPPILNVNGTMPSTSNQINTSPLNGDGWYIYGAPASDGRFLVQAWVPRALLRLETERVVTGKDASWGYVRHDVWDNLVERKGTVGSVLCDPDAADPAAARAAWGEGDCALLIHVYSGIGGNQREPAARSGIYFGHFAYGIAHVIHEPLADELRFDITFHQIYTHNKDGLVAGAVDWSRYMGDRQFGWGGLRPTSNILVKFDEFNDTYQLAGRYIYSIMNAIQLNLEQMTARYRIGDGRGVTFVAAANNCAQDSNHALFSAIVEVSEIIETSVDFEGWVAANPEQAARLERVRQVGRELRQKLGGRDTRRADWRYGIENLGISENPVRNLIRGLGTWRTVLPRKASDTCAQIFLDNGAALWVLSTYQVGGLDPDVEPIAPLTF